MTDGEKRLPVCRYSPFMKGTEDKEKQKEEVVRLGVELSLFVAEAMFLLSDDRRSMSRFCFLLLYEVKMDHRGPTVGRVLSVIQYVFATYIKPKNRVYYDGGKSSLSQLINRTFLRENFIPPIKGLAHIVSILKTGCLVKLSDFEQYNQDLEKLEQRLRCVKHVSEANGFEREAIEFNILHMWTSLFETTTPDVVNLDKTILIEMFGPLFKEIKKSTCARNLASLVIS